MKMPAPLAAFIFAAFLFSNAWADSYDLGDRFSTDDSHHPVPAVNIGPRNAEWLKITASGFSGTLSGSFGSGATITAPVTKTNAATPFTISNATAAGFRTVLCDTSGGVLTVNLPVTPVAGEIIYIKRITTDGTALTIGRSAKKIENASSDISDTNTALVNYALQYDSTSGSWYIF